MREFLLTLCVVTAVTYLLTGPVRKFAIIAGAMPEIRDRDVHKEPTPRLGGIAMFGGLCAGLLVADHLSKLSSIFSEQPGTSPRCCPAPRIMWVIGVLDDKWGVDALVKLGGQMVAAGVMVFQGVTVLWLPIPGVGTVVLHQTWGTFIAVALVVISVNAVNFIDGLDGLAAGMVCIAALAFFVYSYRLSYGYGITDALPATLFSAILVGMCLGFLPHNLHPARIFMGDSGALLLGLVLSVVDDLAHRPRRPQRDHHRLADRRRARHGADLHPAAAAADRDRGPAGRPGPGGGAPHLERPVAVRGGQAATCTTGCCRSGTRTAARS